LTVLFDSWAWIEFFRDGKKADEVEEYIKKPLAIYISAVTVAEVLRYLLSYETKAAAEKSVKFMIHRSVVLHVDTEVAWLAAALKHQHKWGLGDALIYATAQLNKLHIVTGDSDFKGKPNVIYLGI